ncbi:hypothetical protein DOTSEDRAFT_44039 [Dothistroma septosporum NZE10]|uniref:Uncharacterized protein n=1 Tax=Dothistroma septosporum (strain NZE10 / CBS 128990) TaxID=675120 RepID=N1PTQ6_DOTSN|nr:hypothetical protein DOTSEDRAFT_44039 [Dothistroma septosporum NZE10]
MHLKEVVTKVHPEAAAEILDPESHDKLVKVAQHIRAFADRLAHAGLAFGFVDHIQFKVVNQLSKPVEVEDRANEHVPQTWKDHGFGWGADGTS